MRRKGLLLQGEAQRPERRENPIHWCLQASLECRAKTAANKESSPVKAYILSAVGRGADFADDNYGGCTEKG